MLSTFILLLLIPWAAGILLIAYSAQTLLLREVPIFATIMVKTALLLPIHSPLALHIILKRTHLGTILLLIQHTLTSRGFRDLEQRVPKRRRKVSHVKPVLKKKMISPNAVHTLHTSPPRDMSLLHLRRPPVLMPPSH